MNYMDYKRLDVLNGEGVRNSLFVSGCGHRCKGCFNPSSWSHTAGKPFTDSDLEKIVNDLNNEEEPVRGLSLLGGEPMDNAKELIKVVFTVRSKCPNKDIWMWSGYTFEEIISDNTKKELLRYVDVLIDGKFEIDKKNLKLKFRGSENQRIIDVKKSLAKGKVIFYYESDKPEKKGFFNFFKKLVLH